MNAGTIWSYVVTVVGLLGFILAGRKVWWAWYVNIGCQALWFIFGLVTAQYGFIIASIVYTVIFTQNAIRWTKDRPKNYKQMDWERLRTDYSRGFVTPQEVSKILSGQPKKEREKWLQTEETKKRYRDHKTRRPWIATEAEAQEAYLKGIPPIQDTHLIVKNTRKH